MSVGENVKFYREKKPLSIAKFAGQIGLTVDECKLIESGQRTISSAEIQTICRVLDIGIEALLADRPSVHSNDSTDGSMLMPVEELQKLLGKMQD